MTSFIFSVLAGTLAGAVAGATLAWWLIRHLRRAERPAPQPPILDPAALRDIDTAARAWAASSGQPETVAGLVADKLRLVYELTARRNRP